MTRVVAMPPFAFDSPAAAVEAMISRLQPIEPERVSLRRAFGRSLAHDMTADRPSPACDVSAMDGYAVRIVDLSEKSLAISNENSAGRPSATFKPGTAMRIFTGAPVPEGADAVIPREQVDEQPDKIMLDANLAVTPGQHIRQRGENGKAGQVVASTGSIVTPAVAAALASFGHAQVTVHRPLRVTALVTGDEVLGPHEPVQPWQLRDSNGPTLEAMFGRLPWIDWNGVVHVSDDPVTLRRAVDRALDESDALLLTGGVSMGDHDYVPRVLTELNCKQVFHKLPIRPGKPLLGAIGPRGQAVLGLPGNPISVMITARLIAAPVLERLAGMTPSPPPAVELDNPDSATLYLHWSRPVLRTAPGHAALVSNKGSGDIVAAARSDGFVHLPPQASGPGPWPFYAWTLER